MCQNYYKLMFQSSKNHTVPCAEAKVRWKESEVFREIFSLRGMLRVFTVVSP